jgi:hypothetical protein
VVTVGILDLFVAGAVLFTGGSCAAIDNSTNTMVWNGLDTPHVRTTYRDEGGVLLPEARYPDDVDALLAIVHAEESLTTGAPGRKIPLRCFKSIDGVPHEVTGGTLDHDHERTA